MPAIGVAGGCRTGVAEIVVIGDNTAAAGGDGIMCDCCGTAGTAGTAGTDDTVGTAGAAGWATECGGVWFGTEAESGAGGVDATGSIDAELEFIFDLECSSGVSCGVGGGGASSANGSVSEATLIDGENSDMAAAAPPPVQSRDPESASADKVGRHENACLSADSSGESVGEDLSNTGSALCTISVIARFFSAVARSTSRECRQICLWPDASGDTEGSLTP